MWVKRSTIGCWTSQKRVICMGACALESKVHQCVVALMLGSGIKEKSPETRSVANESGRYVFLKVLQMKMELQGIG